MRLKELLELLRVKQWYKNLLIFLPMVFVKQLFNPEAVLLTCAGFIALCFISSTNYIINDIIDRRKDRIHPEKKKRPIASGKIKISQAVVILSVFFFCAIAIGAMLNPFFLYSLFGLFALTQAYTLILKKEPFVDIILIGVNFVIRAASGAFIISVIISPWLIVCVFFLALFLSVGKREADFVFLGEKAEAHRQVLKHYTPKITNSLMNIATVLLITSYSFYSFLSEHHNLFFTLPFALYVIFRYYYLVNTGSEIARHPEKGLKDIRLVLGSLMWMITTVLVLYYSG